MKRLISLINWSVCALATRPFLLLPASLALLTADASAQCVPPPAGLVSWWRAEGDAFDRAGLNHGTVGMGVGFAAGQAGQAFNFTADGQLVTVPASSSLDVGAGPGFTVEGWVNPTQIAVQMPIADWNNAGNPGAHFWISVSYAGFGGPGAIYASLNGGIPGIFATGPGVIQVGVWQHVAMTWDQATGEARLFRNGIQVAVTNLSGQTPATSPNLTIGGRPGSSSFRGRLDELAVYDRALSGAELLVIYNAGAAGKCPPAPPPPNGPGDALSFDGADDYLSAAPTNLPVGNSAYTIEAWIRPDVMHVGAVAAWGDYAPNQANAFVLDVDSLVNYWWGNDLKLLTTNLAGAWHHVAATFDGTTRRILLDGVSLTNDVPLGHTASASNFRIGRANLGQYFDGLMDEVRIWNVARTTNQIQAGMRRQLFGNESGLVACYRFDEGNGVNAFDTTGRPGNTAMLVNGPVWTPSFLSPFVPDILTGGVDQLTPRSARLNGLLGANGAASTGYFEWGPTTNYGSVTPGASLPDAFVGYWTHTLTGLVAGATFHFRAVATNSLGASYGLDDTFSVPFQITVISTADSGVGSLRQAIQDAAPGDTIDLGVSGVITLGSELVVNKDLTIRGPGAMRLSLSDGGGRVFNVTAGRVSISGVNIAGGRFTGTQGEDGIGPLFPGGAGGGAVGGGILNRGDLTLVDCMFVANFASGGAGGRAGGNLFNQNIEPAAGGVGGEALGGAICNSNRLAVVNCTWFSNACFGGRGGIGGEDINSGTATGGRGGAGGRASGGAIFNAGLLWATNCTFFANRCRGGDGGTGGDGNAVAGGRGGNGEQGVGGAIVDFGTSAIVNCTINGNLCDGGAAGSGGNGNQFQGGSGLSGFGVVGGCYQSGNSLAPVFVRNTIVAGNIAASGANTFGYFVSGGFNLLGLINDSGFTTGFTQPSDQVGLGTPIDPRLGTFGSYGGATWVLPLQTNSPALDRGHSSGIATDQRGFARPVDAPQAASVAGGDGADIGAFELHRGTLHFVTNTLSGNAPGSLWWAISNANSSIGGATIAFNIPGAGPHTIRPTTALPGVSNPMTIDGYTQPGASPNTRSTGSDAVLKIELSGGFAGNGVDGLFLQTGDCTVRGLVVNDFSRHGIRLSGPSNVVSGNFIGLDTTGTQARSNLVSGIYGLFGSYSLIGGTTPPERNVISASPVRGVYFSGGTGNRIQGNYIGTDASGTVALGNREGFQAYGIGDVMGGAIAGAGNLISGNYIGIGILGNSNVVQGNLIGLNADGSAALGNPQSGISIGGNTNLIGGTNALARNVISASLSGISIINTPRVANQVIGNFIGTDITGRTNIGNGTGVYFLSGPSGNFIGGTDPGAGNVISGSTASGVFLGLTNTTGNVVAGNLIGLASDGATPLPNADGVNILDAPGNTVGGTNSGAGNIISGNTSAGVRVGGDWATNNAISGNRIFSNGGLGIDLGGVTLNDVLDADTGPNHLQNFPIVTAAVRGGGVTSVAGTFNSTPNTVYSLEFFYNDTADLSGFGEGQRRLGARMVTTDGSGNASFSTIFPTFLNTNQFVTATATDPAGNTSEFSAARRVSLPRTVVNTSDSGPGSLRAAIDSANAATGTNIISFDIPGPGPHTINLASPLPVITAPVWIDGQRFVTGGGGGFGPAADVVPVPGTVLNGTNAGPGAHGLHITSSNVVIRGLVIQGFNGHGILLSNASGCVLEGNYIGTDATGALRVANDLDGIHLENAPASTISTSVIAGNRGHGVLMINSPGTEIRQCRIGNGPASPAALPLNNSGHGVFVVDSAFVRITDGNVIGGNSGDGVRLVGGTTHDCLISQNYLGVDNNGASPLGNGSAGVAIFDAFNNQVGGPSGGHNWIAYNAAGVTVAGVRATNNAIRANSIHSNGGLGIDLDASGISADGPTLNDTGDADDGPNHLQNHPVLAAASPSASTVLSGFLMSRPATVFRLEFFANTSADPSGFGEGELFIGATDVATDEAGNVSFRYVSADTASLGQFVTATATDPAGNTSEFSPAAQVAVASPGTPVILVNGQAVLGPEIIVSNATALVSLQTAFAGGVIRFTLDGSDPLQGAFYAGPFVVANGAMVRAVAFSPQLQPAPEAAPVVIRFRAPPVIIVQPQGRTVAAGNNVTFEVAAAGTPPLAFQWQFNGVAIFGATNAILALNAVPGAAGQFRVVVSNAFGVVTSVVAVLTVVTAPMVTAQPTGVSVSLGSNVTFCVTNSGTPPVAYQWRLNGANLPGATASCLTITNVQLTNGGSYTVVVANDAGAVTSDPALLTVLVPTVPGNDAFASATVLSNSVIRGSNLNATHEPGETNHVGKLGSNSVWYAWTAPGNGIATFETAGSAFDTLLAVYKGPTVAQLTLVANDEDEGGFYTSRLRFTASSNTTYKIVVDGFAGQQGDFVLSWALEPTIEAVPVITGHPVSRVVAPGSNATFSVTAIGTGLSYRWLLGGVELPGATASTLTVSNAQAANVGAYAVRVTNSVGRTARSFDAILEVGSVPGPVSRDKFEDLFLPGEAGGGGGLAGVVPPVQGQPIQVPLGTRDFRIVNPTNSTTQAGENHCGVIAQATRWMHFTPLESGHLVFDTKGSGTNCILAVYTVDTLNFERALQACTTNGEAGVFLANVLADQRYYIAMDKTNGLIQLNWQLGRPPVFTETPTNRLLAQGSTLTLSVLATNPIATNTGQPLPPPAYRWFFNDRPLAETAGGFSNILNMGDVQVHQAGRYFAVASNAFGLATSAVARVDIVQLPVAPTVAAGTRLSLSALTGLSNCPTRFQWLHDGVIVPRATNSTIQFTNADCAIRGTYSLAFSNCIGTATYQVGTLSVTGAPPRLTWSLAPATVWPVGSNLTLAVALEPGGAPASLQWRFNGVDLPGRTTTTLPWLASRSGEFSVMASNCFGGVTSFPTRLIVVRDVQFRPIVGAGGPFVLQWTVAAGRTDQVQYKNSLSDPQWLPLPQPVEVIGSTATVRDFPDPGSGRFYRIFSPE